MFEKAAKKIILDALNDPEVKRQIDEFIKERIRQALKDALKGFEQDKENV